MRRYRRESFTARQALACVAFIGLVVSFFFNLPIQQIMTNNQATAYAFTIGVVLSGPACLAFWLPWSPAAMFLTKIRMKTFGQYAVLAVAVIMSYYMIYTHYGYWMAQPAYEVGYATQQTAVGYLIFYVLPALLWAPVLREEAIETMKQDQLVREYELFTEKRIQLLRAEILQAEQIAMKKWADMLPEEKAHLALMGNRLAQAIGRTLEGVGLTMSRMTGTIQDFPMDREAEDLLQVFDSYADKLLPAGKSERYKRDYYSDALDEPEQLPRRTGRETRRLYLEDDEQRGRRAYTGKTVNRRRDW